MIDSHCHLTDPRLFSQLDNVLARAAAAGVCEMVTIGTSVDESRAAIDIARHHANVHCTVGIHPNNSADAAPEDIVTIKSLSFDPVVVAIGEAGLDYHYDIDCAAQRSIFEKQLALATELDKPIVIHCREATDDCIEMMRGMKSGRAVYHCFTASPGEAEKILAAGFLIGFTGAVTFKKNDALREAAALVPRDRLLIETDAPYLSPEPMRTQKTNEPALVVHVAQVIANIWNVELREVDRITTDNTRRFYRM